VKERRELVFCLGGKMEAVVLLLPREAVRPPVLVKENGVR
jgi:hypothetical protein